LDIYDTAFSLSLLGLLLGCLGLLQTKLKEPSNYRLQGGIIATGVVTTVFLLWRYLTVAVAMPYYFQGLGDDWTPHIGWYLGLAIGGVGGGIYLLLLLGGQLKEKRHWVMKLLLFLLAGSLYGAICLSALWSITIIPFNPYASFAPSLVGFLIAFFGPSLGVIWGIWQAWRVKTHLS
jgi:hypothetical protein